MDAKRFGFRTLARVGLCVVLSLLLRADSCTTVDREVSTPVLFFLQYDVDVSMNTALVDTVFTSADVAAPMLAALEARRNEALPDTVFWVAMSATFVRNDGFDTTRALRLGVGDPGAPILFAQTQNAFKIPNNRVGTTAIVAATGTGFEGEFLLDMVEGGTGGYFELHRIANEALEEFRSTGDITPRELEVRSIWTNDRSPGDPADDFTLRIRLSFQMPDERDVEVYNP